MMGCRHVGSRTRIWLSADVAELLADAAQPVEGDASFYLSALLVPNGSVLRRRFLPVRSSWQEVAGPPCRLVPATDRHSGMVLQVGCRVGLLLEPADQLVGRHRPADVVALDGVTAQRVQFLQGPLVLHALGDHTQPE